MSRETCSNGHDLTLPGALTNQGRCRVCKNAAVRRYARTEKGRAALRAASSRYTVSDKGRARSATYRSGPKGRATARDAQSRFRGTAKGMLADINSNARRRGQ